jgi:ParB-like chromosome segregation protein Spo0J
MSKAFSNQNGIAGIVRITDNMFKVDINLVVTEDCVVGENEDKLRFFNPRSVEINPEAELDAFSSENMEFLKDSIKNTGLVNPLIGRVKDGKVSIIEGHRRWAAINQLIEEDAACYDVSSGTQIPASALYSFVLMRVYDENITEEECFAMSFQEDKSKHKFGSGAEVRFVYHCILRDEPDSKILNILKNSPEWLKETKSLIKALEDDDAILNALFTDRINRQAAKVLASIEDQHQRRAIFEEAKKEAEEIYREKIGKLSHSISVVENKIENVKTKKVIAERVKKSEDLDKYDEEILELTGVRKEIENKMVESVPVINVETVKEGVTKAIKAGKGRPGGSLPKITSERISAKWRAFFSKLKDRPQIGDQDINPDLASMCADLLNQCTDKENDPEKFIMEWNDKIS